MEYWVRKQDGSEEMDMEKKTSVIKYIKSDFERNHEGGSIIAFIKILFVPRGYVFAYQVWFRLLQDCKKSKWKKYTVGIFVYLIERHYEYKYGIHANANMSVGQGLNIVHGDGVFLNCRSIGDNFTCYPGVMLGASGDASQRGGSPTIEDNVTIYTGAVVTGNVILHSGCVVAANAYVNTDVPENTMVAGLPARVIRKIEKL